MGYLAGGPIQQVARVTVEAAASSQQVNIPVPGGFVPGMTDVYVGGACLSLGDYDDTDGMQIKLRNGMAAGTQYRVVAFGAYTNQQPVSGQLAGFRNRIINGDMRVAQRGAYQQNGAAAGKAFAGPDRFQIVTIGTPGGTVTQAAGTISFQGIARPAIFQTVNSAATNIAGSNAWSGFQYVIEGFDAYDLLGNPVSISFIFATATTGLYSVCLRDYTGTQSCISQFMATAGVPTRVVVPVPALPLNLGVPASNTGGLTLTIGAVSTGQFQTTNPLGAWGPSGFLSAAGNVNWISAANNFIALAELQLEPGYVATQFERRPIGVEIAACQRYFRRVVAGSYALGGSTKAQSVVIANPSMCNTPQCLTNMTDANFVGGAPGANQWGMEQAAVAYGVKSAGTFTVSGRPLIDSLCISIYGAILVDFVDHLNMGSGMLVDFTAEL